MSNIILLYKADNINITGEYFCEIIQECSGEGTGEVEYNDVKLHYMNIYTSVLVNGKLRTFGLQFKLNNEMQIENTKQIAIFINTMHGMGYMEEFKFDETSVWVEEIIKISK